MTLDRLDGGGLDPSAGGAVAERAGALVLADWTRALAATADIGRDRTRTMPVLVAEIAAQNGAAPALLSERETMSYAALAARVDRYARWALGAGIARGDAVALLMENRPEYVAIWLGLTKIGAVVALLNTNLREGSLAHCVKAAAPVLAIVSADYAEAWDGALEHLTDAPTLWLHGCDRAGVSRLDITIDTMPDAPVMVADVPTVADRALLIYTSGTTGLPKAAIVSHGRVLSWSLWFAGMLDTGPADRMYDCLPLYHSVGGVVAIGALLARGGSVVIAPSFSASRFWRDVGQWDCTLAQYIGELCRYLLAAPDTRDPPHRLRAICGNGLRADVWERFQARFAVPRIVEFYAASEGTFSLYNMEGRPGAIGRVPGFLRHRFPAAIVRFDADADAVARDADGRCIRVAAGEPGEAIGRVSGPGSGAFEGYTDAGATRSKILRDVFAEGDAWVRTGDLMRIDTRGFWYFVDRVGETFRWKGENVSTVEVGVILAACPGVADLAVYGVEVPRADGRAGMVALTTTPSFDLAVFARHVTTRLPAYARPLFLRLTGELETTGTFKHRTQTLAREAFDPRATAEPVYLLDVAGASYRRLDDAVYDALLRGDVRV